MTLYKNKAFMPHSLVNIGIINTNIKHKHNTIGKSYTKEDYYYTEGVYSSFSYNFSFTNRDEYLVIEKFFNAQMGRLHNFWGRTFKNTFEVFDLLGLGNKLHVKYTKQHKLLDYNYLFIYFPEYDFATRVVSAKSKTAINGIDVFTEFILEDIPPAVTKNLQIEQIFYGHFNTDTLTANFDDINMGLVTLPFVENVNAQYKVDLGL